MIMCCSEYGYGCFALDLCLLILGAGAIYDIRERRVPNLLLLLAFSMACFWAFESDVLLNALLRCLIINLMGLFLHKNRVLPAGDIKYTSIVLMLVDVSNPVIAVAFIISLIVLVGIIVLCYYPRHNKSIAKELKQLWTDIKGLIYKLNLFPPDKMRTMTKDEKIKKTIPFTPVLFGALLITFLISTWF